MHASDDTPLSEFLIDTALVRGAIDGRNDDRFVRGRLATAAGVLGTMFLAWFAAAWPFWPAAAFGIPLLLLGIWLYADGFRWAAARYRRRTGARPSGSR
jgi:hypothetical protein